MGNPLESLSGKVVPAVYTPFQNSEQEPPILARGHLKRYVLALRDAGMDALYLLGTTGQGMELSNEFRMEMLKYFVSYLPKSIQLIVHVGAKTSEQAVELADHAAMLAKINPRILALSAKPPQHMNYEQEMRYHEKICRAIARRTAYVPYFLGESLSVPVRQYAQDLIGLRAVAVKFTSHDMQQLEELASVDQERLYVFSGEDTLVMKAQKLGAFACIGSTYNWNGDWVQRMRDIQVADPDAREPARFERELKSVVDSVLGPDCCLPRLYDFARQAVNQRWNADIGASVDPKFYSPDRLDSQFVSGNLKTLQNASSQS